jgi:hypothetical protein
VQRLLLRYRQSPTLSKKTGKRIYHNFKVALKEALYPLNRLDAPALFSPAKGKTIEMVFNHKKRTGGWVDRVKGMLSCLEVARQTGRTLVIHVDDTFPIDKYFDPGATNVKFETGPVRWSLFQSAFHVSNDNKKRTFLKLAGVKRKQLFVDTNLDYLSELYPGETEEYLNHRRMSLFHQIFHLKPGFQKTIEENTPAKPIAIHSRFTSLLGDFKDVQDRPLDDVKRKALLDLCCSQVLALVENYPDNSVMLFSDSKTFLDTCCALSPRILRLSGTPKHIDHTADHDDALYKTLLDFFVITRCESVYLLLNKPMYNSNFSKYAAIFGGKAFYIEK